MKYILSIISTLFVSSSVLAVAGKAGPGCCVKSCRADCEQNQSVTTSEYNGCVKKCDTHFQKEALQQTAVIIPVAVVAPKAKEAPKAPPAKATIRNVVAKKEVTPVKAPAPAREIKKEDSTPKA